MFLTVEYANHSLEMSQSVAQNARDNGVDRTCSGGVCFPKGWAAVLSPKACSTKHYHVVLIACSTKHYHVVLLVIF